MARSLDLGSVDVPDDAKDAFEWWGDQSAEIKVASWLTGVFMVRHGFVEGFLRRHDKNEVSLEIAKLKTELQSMMASIEDAYRHGYSDRGREMEVLLASRLKMEKQLVEAAMEKAICHERERSCRESIEDRERLIREVADERAKLARVQGELEHVSSALNRAETELRDRRALQERVDLLMMHSNHAKGVVGERLVASELSRRFPSMHIEHKGGGIESKSQDVWMFTHSESNKFIAFEVKNKTYVSKTDIEKFQRDLETMPDCTGAMLVSLTSGSIPGRGRFSIEVIDRRPCLFVAFEDHEAFRLMFADYAQVLVTLVETSGVHVVDNEVSHLSNLVEKLQPILERMKRLKKDVFKITSNAREISSLADTFQVQLTETTECFAEMLKNTCALKRSSHVTKAHFKCAKCERVFVTRAACVRHEQRHAENITITLG